MTSEELKQWIHAHGLTFEEFSRLLPMNRRTLETWMTKRGRIPDYFPRALRDLDRELQKEE